MIHVSRFQVISPQDKNVKKPMKYLMMQHENSERRPSTVSKNKRKKLKSKRVGVSEAQKLAFVKGCQTSYLTVGEYAKHNKIGESSLYRWAALSGVPLKSGYGKEIEEAERQVASERFSTKTSVEEKRQAALGWLESKEVKAEIQPLRKNELRYKQTFKH